MVFVVSYLPRINRYEILDAATRHPRPALLVALSALIALEAVAFVAVTVFLIVEIFAAPADSVASAIALTVVVAIAAVWLAAIVRGLWHSQPWTRGATIVVQVLLIAIAVGSFQGIGPRPDIGWLILAPAIVALVLVLSKPVQRELTGV